MSFPKKVLCLLLCMALVVTLSLTCLADNTGEEKIGTCLATSPMGDIQIVDGSDTDVDWDAVRVTIREAAMAMQETIDLSSFGISNSSEHVSTLRNFLFNEPCILRNISTFRYSSTTSAIVTIYPTYTYTKAEFDKMYSACQDVIQTMLYGVKDNSSLSTAQKVLLIHDRLATWSEYDYANLKTNSVPNSSYSPYGVLVLKVGVCDGYARAFSWIMDELGIENYYVSSQTLKHAWNIVVIDGEKYYVDTTFDDPNYDITGRVNHKNLLVSYNTLKANEHNASDFDTDATSTKYESMFWSGITSECVTINGNIYYISVSGNVPTIKKVTSNGSISTVRSLGTQIWYASSSGYYQGCFTRLAACGTALLYSTPTEIRTYDTATGEDGLVWKPSLSGYSAYTYIYGMTLKDGVIYCELATSPTGSSSNRIILTKSFCTHQNTKVLSKSATCVNAGQIQRICTDCRKVTKEASTDTVNHTYGSWTVVKAATCVDTGTQSRTCSVCKKVETQTIAATGVHSYGEWTVTTEATYSSEGERTRTCQYCDAVERESIPRKTLATPSITKTENAATGVKLTWGKVDGTTKYRVYFKISGASKYTKFGDVTTTTATVIGLTSGTKYVFTVKALAGSNTSAAATASGITYCAMPTVSKTENNSTGVKLTWSKVTDATKYRVYYKLSTASKYTTYKDVTGNSVTVTGLTAGKSYVFTVKAYNGSWSANKATSAVVYRPVPTVSKLTNAAKGITVTWTKISGASKYALYYKVNGASSWTCFSSKLTSTSATVTGLTSGKSYVFTVKAYVGGGWSTNVSSSAIVRVNAVTLSGLTNSASKTMKVTWKKDTTLTGYQIQYSLKKDFSDAKTVAVKSNSTVSQTFKSLTKGKTYYVRIRGYKTVNSVTTYGAWSSAKSLKITK